MGNLLAYSGLVTKVRAMQAKLLKAEDYQTIANMNTVSEITEYLKGTDAYGSLIRSVNEEQLHRSDLEKILPQSLYNDYIRLYRFAGMKQKEFLKLYLKRYEVRLINYCLRIVFNHYNRPFDLNYKKAFFEEYSNLSIEKLITSKNVHELVENLKDTEYYRPLKKLEETKEATLFDYDLALNLYYYTTMWKKRKKVLKKKELEIFTRDAGTKIDLLNLQWIYRAKKYYKMLPPDIYALLIPVQYRISIELTKELVEAPTVDEFFKIVAKTSYMKNVLVESNATIEQRYKECLYHLYIADKRSNPYSIASVNTYLFLKEEELEKLTTILECVRYGISAKDSLSYIGGTVK